MQTVILVGGAVVFAIYVWNRNVPAFKDTVAGQTQEEAKKLGIATTQDKITKEVSYYDPEKKLIVEEKRETSRLEENKYIKCTSDDTCQSNALFGATTRCIGSRCVPMVAEDSALGIMWSPSELGLKSGCERYYLLGEGQTCEKDTQCSSSGVICDPTDKSCRFSTGISGAYCSNQGKCRLKTNKDWLGIRWKQEELSESRVNSLGVPNVSEQNKIQREILSRNYKCPELKFV